MVEITATEKNKEKKMKRTEGNLRELWENIKRGSRSHQRGSRRRREKEKIFEKIIAENFPNMGKETVKLRKHRESHTE